MSVMSMDSCERLMRVADEKGTGFQRAITSAKRNVKKGNDRVISITWKSALNSRHLLMSIGCGQGEKC